MTADWPSVIASIEPLCFQVHAGDSIGTAFGIAVSGTDGDHHCMLVTALHVVDDVLGNERTLELIRSDGSIVSKLVNGPVRIYPVGPPECDSALIEIPTIEPLLTASQLQPLPLTTMSPRGSEIGWLGYPGLVFPELCFFHGVVSGYQEQPPIYLVDGVAINGVSGGPAFDSSGLLIGLISAYIPNQISASTTLPGLMIITPINLIRLWMQEMLGAQVQFRK